MTARAGEPRPRVGLVGYGYLGRGLANRLLAEPGLELAFVNARRRAATSDLPDSLVLDDLDRAAEREPTLVVEVAHPEITRAHGERIVSHADYLPVSTSALIDDDLREALSAAALGSGHRVLLPQGALVGATSLSDADADSWESVSITMRKNPGSIDFSNISAPNGSAEYKGSVRELAAMFPRNVNSMVTCALATAGLDACAGRLVADPALDVGMLEVEARGRDGSVLAIRREQPMRGVSGTEMLDSVWGSVRRAIRSPEPIAIV